MARNFTMGTLVTRCKQRADMENSGLIGDSEWKGMISSVYAELYSILVESGLRYFESEDTITTDGTATYAVPADHLATIGVDYEVNATSGERRELDEFMAQERNLFTGFSGASWASAFALVGSNVTLYPTPPTGQTYYHVYVPQPTDHSSTADGTNIDVVTPDGEQFLTWGTAVMALKKEESEVREAVIERERFRKRVEMWATMRSLNNGRRRIVAHEFDYHYPRYPGDWER